MIRSKLFSGFDQKVSPYCVQIVQEKIRRLIVRKQMERYIDDMKHAMANNEIIIETEKSIHKIKNYFNSLPYLGSVFYQPN